MGMILENCASFACLMAGFAFLAMSLRALYDLFTEFE